MKKYLTLAYFLTVGLTACGSNHSSAQATDSNTAATTTASCSADPRVTPYADNMIFKGTAYNVQLVSADPAQPATGLNTWTFKVTDASGSAVDNANVTITPWMPDHGHGPSVVPQVTDAAGVYTGTNIDLFMPGVWQLTFSVNGTTAQDQAVIDFCIAG